MRGLIGDAELNWKRRQLWRVILVPYTSGVWVGAAVLALLT